MDTKYTFLVFVFSIFLLMESTLITTDVTASSPCQGDTVFTETFINGIPPTWVVIDLDSLTPNDTSSWTGSWEPVNLDGNPVVGNTSWFKPAGKANDYLITPAIALSGSVPSCLSFKAKSEDPNWKDGYEVRISTSTPNDSGLQANPAILSVSSESSDWTTHTIDLAAYLGKTIYIGFWHTANDKSAIYMDDVLITEPKSFDLTVNTMFIGKRISPGNYDVTAIIENYGSSTITSMNYNWSLDGGAAKADALTSLSIAPYTTDTFTHSIKFSAASPGTYSIKVWCSSLNGTNDQNPANDTLTQLGAISNGVSASKFALIEEFTGAWCGACPDGHYVIDTIKENFFNIIDIRIHTSDDMEITDSKDLADIYPTFYPAGLIDRIPFNIGSSQEVALHRQYWATKTEDRLNSSTPVFVDVSNSYNSSTRVLNATVSAKFVDYVQGDVRFLVYITESNVTGSGAGYDQRNFFNGVTGSPFFGKGDPIIGYVHNDVLRSAPLGVWGKKDILPTTINPNDTFSTSFTYTIPVTHKESDVRVVASIYVHSSDIKQREVLNSVISTIWTTNISEKQNDVSGTFIRSVYPNPAKTISAVTFNIEKSSDVTVDVHNILGEKLSTLKKGTFLPGQHSVYFNVTDVPAGMYFIAVKTPENTLTEKFVVIK